MPFLILLFINYEIYKFENTSTVGSTYLINADNSLKLCNKYLDKTKSDLVQVSNDFLKDSKIKFPKQEKKKGGPYSKNEKHQRLNEVYRLHFEYGYSARQISDMMKISRNTINGDISYWYDKIGKKMSSFVDPEMIVVKHITRLELQRTRLRVSLDKTKMFSEKLAIEKLIFNIENKIMQTRLKLIDSQIRSHDNSTKRVNDWLKKQRRDERFLSIFDVYSVSEKSHQKIRKIMNQDKKNQI